MKTLKPLKELLPEVLAHAVRNREYLMYNNRLMLVHEGQLRKEIEDSMQVELSPAAFQKAIKRVPSINLLVRIIDKLSRVYTDPAQRAPSNQADEELLRWYEDELNLMKVMPSCNRMYNLHKCCALEPYLCEGRPSLRVIPASRFIVFSDRKDNPLEPTVFVKLMGQELKIPYTNRDGEKTNRIEPYFVDVYHLFSDDEILIVDSDGDVRQDHMDQYGLDGTNPIGQIPFVYVNKSEFFLLPVPDTDTLDNTVLIPKLLADLNYAVQFQSHSVAVATDLTLPNEMTWNPDVVLSLKTDDGAKQQGHLTTIKPTVDIEKVLLLIETIIAFWLEARNIKTTSVVGKVTAEAASSGIAKIIDEADATQDRRAQMTVFQQVEEELWELVAKLHAYWSTTGQIEERRLFSNTFTVGVKYANMLPMQSEQDETNIIRDQIELGLINKRMAVQRLNPHLGPTEIDALLKSTGDSDLTISGSQLKDLVVLVTAISAGQIPRDTGIGLIAQAFSTTTAAAEKMLGSAGKVPVVQPIAQPTGNGTSGTPNPGQPAQSGPANSGTAPQQNP